METTEETWACFREFTEDVYRMFLLYREVGFNRKEAFALTEASVRDALAKAKAATS